MEALIAELERATEGSRDLELAIALETNHKATGGQPSWRSIREGVAQDGRQKFLSDTLGYVHQIPRWTRSLDAALTLVPEQCGWNMNDDGEGCVFQRVKRAGGPGWPIIGNCEGNTTPALALCIASLKARQAMKDTA